MIRTAIQLKALVRNKSHGNSVKAQIILRGYAMERFLERVSISRFRDSIILKGGTLIAAMVGQEHRSTMDIDVTVKQHPLSVDDATQMVSEIMEITLDDGVRFEIKSATVIMDEADYTGVRITMDVLLDSMRIPLKLDFSTGDIITPQEITFSYPMMFEERTVSVLAYNIETILAEKLETILARGVANTRMRDFYDLYALDAAYADNIDPMVLKAALKSTSTKRGSSGVIVGWELLLSEIQTSESLRDFWQNYQKKYDYAAEISWMDVIEAVISMCERAF